MRCANIKNNKFDEVCIQVGDKYNYSHILPNNIILVF